MSDARLYMVIVATVVAAVPASAQALVPLSAATTEAAFGLDHLSGPTLRLSAAPKEAIPTREGRLGLQTGPTLSLRTDPAAALVGAELGAQSSQWLVDGAVFVREAVAGGPFVSGAGAGVGGGGAVGVGGVIGDVVVVAGPRVYGVAVVKGGVPGRVMVDGVVAVRVPVASVVSVGGYVSAGGEAAHRGGVVDSAIGVAGSAGVSVQLSW
jgi:hypothetical protein